VVTANVHSDADASALRSCLASLISQAESLQAIYLSWYGEGQALAEQVTTFLGNMPEVVSIRATRSSERFEHISLLAGHLRDAPAHSWLALVDAHELWNPRCALVLLPHLRKAAVDQRILAACCKSGHATSMAGAAAPSNAAEVDAALEAGCAQLLVGSEGQEPDLVDYVVKVKSLLTFLEVTPPGMMSHELCTYRFLYKMSHTYGKKVQMISLPEAALHWLRWKARTVTAGEASLTDADRQRGEEFFQSLKGTERFASAEVVSLLLAGLRQSVLRRMAQWAGEKVAAKEMKAMTLERTTAFLEENDLTEVLGLHRWVRDISSEIADAAKQEFSITVSAD
jgi:hypothetical protein